MNISILQTLVDLAKSRSTAAANQLAREMAIHQDGLNKLSMLSDFKDGRFKYEVQHVLRTA